MAAIDIRGHSMLLRKKFPSGTLLLHYKPRRKWGRGRIQSARDASGATGCFHPERGGLT